MFDFTLTLLLIIVGFYLSTALFGSKLSARQRHTQHNMPLIINRRGAGTIHGRRFPVFPSLPVSDAEASKPQASMSNGGTEFESNVEDVLVAKQLLMKAGGLPVELADIIMDYAEYWACSVSSINFTTLPDEHLKIRGGTENENRFLIRTMPLGLTGWHPEDEEAWREPAVTEELENENSLEIFQKYVDELEPPLQRPCRKIVFDITACDQGWGGDYEDHGTYRGSWTWFDAGLERFNAKPDAKADDLDQSALRPLWPPLTTRSEEGTSATHFHQLDPTPEHRIHSNKLAVGVKQNHHVEWKWNDDLNPEELEAEGRGGATGKGEFVRNLKLGDVVTVWGRARFASWQNQVDRVEVKVYWAA